MTDQSFLSSSSPTKADHSLQIERKSRISHPVVILINRFTDMLSRSKPSVLMFNWMAAIRLWWRLDNRWIKVLPFYVFLSVIIITFLYNSVIFTAYLRNEYHTSRELRLMNSVQDMWLTVDDVESELKLQTLTRTQLLNVTTEYLQIHNDFVVKPEHIRFLPEYTSPCWAGSSGLRCLPNVYIAAFPECASTDLWASLANHPQIIGRDMEPSWWTQTRMFRKPLDEYLDIYTMDGNSKSGVTVDGSTDTLWNNQRMYPVGKDNFNRQPSDALVDALRTNEIIAPYLIHQYTPNAKYIIMVRDPVERAYAGYLYNRYVHYAVIEKASKVKASVHDFHEVVAENMGKFSACLSSGNTIRQCAYDRQLRESSLGQQFRFWAGLYIIYIYDLLKVIPRGNVIFVHYDDYRLNKLREIERVGQFMNISTEYDLLAKILEATAEPREKLVEIGPMWRSSWYLLKKFYSPFNAALARYLNDSRFLFRT